MPVSFDANLNGQDGDRLDGWKEIAAYLGKDVRTAHRWSKHEGMPVYRHAGSRRGAVYAYRSEIDAWIHADRSVTPEPSRNTRLKWGALAIVLIVIAGTALFWPYLPQRDSETGPEPNIEPRDPGTVTPVRVLIGAIENQSGEAGLDAALDAALRSELANHAGFETMGSELVSATLALMKRPAGKPIGQAAGRELCLRSGGLCVLLAGRVHNFGSDYLLNLEIIDPVTGRSVASEEESARSTAGLLTAIERVAGGLVRRLEDRRGELSEAPKPLERVATSSLRALELFSSGMRILHEFRFDEAETLFRQALNEDPEFATAYVFAYWMQYHQGRGSDEQARALLENALAFAGTASEYERYFIEGTYSDMIERDQEAACQSYRKLAELFPGHYFAAMNAAHVCGTRLGHREDAIRWSTRAASHTERIDANWVAARILIFLARDFERARPHVEWLNARVASGTAPQWALSATDVFRAEELLAGGMLQDVSAELARIESGLTGLEPALQATMARNLTTYHLALGRLRKAEEVGKEAHFPGVLPAWLAYIRGDRTAFAEHMQEFLAWLERAFPEEHERHIWSLGWNMTDPHGFPIDVLYPVYDADDAAKTAASADRHAPLFLSLPKFRAKLQLVRGKSLLDQGRPEEARDPLRQGVHWFGEHGLYETLPYYFLGSELLAVALMELGEEQAAYQVLKAAAGQTGLVNSQTMALHQRIRARVALLARDLGRTEDAAALEAELKKALALADPDHPILMQLRDQQEPSPQTE
jgi:tetratricopeptide (TPR) repeat protein